MSTSIELFSKVHDYIARQMTLRDLENWLVTMLPIYLSNPSSAAAELACTIELGLAEIHAGIRSELNLRRLLAKHLARNQIIKYELYPPQTVTNETTASVVLTEATSLVWTDLSLSWSTEPQVASA